MIHIFLDISVTADNHTRTCGNFSTIVRDTSNFGPNKLRVVFQTNRNRQNSGFMMVVTCVSPDFGDHDGCTQAPSPSGRRITDPNMVTHYIDHAFIHFIVCIIVQPLCVLKSTTVVDKGTFELSLSSFAASQNENMY